MTPASTASSRHNQDHERTILHRTRIRIHRHAVRIRIAAFANAAAHALDAPILPRPRQRRTHPGVRHDGHLDALRQSRVALRILRYAYTRITPPAIQFTLSLSRHNYNILSSFRSNKPHCYHLSIKHYVSLITQKSFSINLSIPDHPTSYVRAKSES